MTETNTLKEPNFEHVGCAVSAGNEKILLAGKLPGHVFHDTKTVG